MIRPATASDTEPLIAMMRRLWLTDAVPFNETLSRQGLQTLLENPTLGRIWIIAPTAGYIILTFGFSLEFGGRDAFIDEFYLEPQYRRQGLGTATLTEVASQAAALDIKALHLEVDDQNAEAERFYLSRGFTKHTRRLMTRWLP